MPHFLFDRSYTQIITDWHGSLKFFEWQQQGVMPFLYKSVQMERSQKKEKKENGWNSPLNDPYEIIRI